MLKEFEWNTIDNMLFELYAIDETKDLSKSILTNLHKLVPFVSGHLILLSDDRKLDSENSFFFGFENTMYEKISSFYDDAIQYICNNFKETVVHHNSRIFINTDGKYSNFHKDSVFLNDFSYNSEIIIAKNEVIIGILNVFRTESLGDFTEKDIFIMNILKRHFENMIHNTKRLSENVSRYFSFAEKKFDLSERENEILKLVAEGKSNNDISETLCVSLSTVKKHVYNIFNKAGVNSRTQLLNSIYMQN